jgi:hypothetical protein
MLGRYHHELIPLLLLLLLLLLLVPWPSFPSPLLLLLLLQVGKRKLWASVARELKHPP